MAEYIKREAVLRAVQGQRSPCRSPAQNRMLDCLKTAVIRISAADVAPVVHGLWEREPASYWRWTPSGAVAVTRTTYRCGLCGRGTAVKSNYCPNCGAKMDGGADNDANRDI